MNAVKQFKKKNCLKIFCAWGGIHMQNCITRSEVHIFCARKNSLVWHIAYILFKWLCMTWSQCHLLCFVLFLVFFEGPVVHYLWYLTACTEFSGCLEPVWIALLAGHVVMGCRIFETEFFKMIFTWMWYYVKWCAFFHAFMDSFDCVGQDSLVFFGFSNVSSLPCDFCWMFSCEVSLD